MMELGQRKEQFSHAFVRAVAAAAGFSVSLPGVDYESVDMTLSGGTSEGLTCPPRIDLQLKCSSRELVRGDQVIYPLDLKNYNELKISEVLVPRLLVIVLVPSSESEWIQQTEGELSMRRCGYWLSLLGMPDTTNSANVSVRLPRANIFDVSALRGLMGRSARKEPL